MRSGGQLILTAAAILVIILSSFVAAETTRRPKKQKEEPAAPASPVDKRDRAVTAPGTPFHGKAYWQAAAQCGGIYFKLSAIYSEAAIRAKVIKPDPPAYAQFTKEADGASKTASAFFVAAESFLITDRKIARDEAVMTYDAIASSNGDRLKSVEAAVQAAKPCPELYRTCRATFSQMCSDAFALTN